MRITKNKLNPSTRLQDLFSWDVDENGCWACTSHSPGRNGYSKLRINKKDCYSHRVSWKIANGLEKEPEVIRHTCDNRNCINPSHLLSGTQSDNMQDMMTRGRHRSSHGEDNSLSTLTGDQVTQIMRDKESTNDYYAKKYGVSSAQVSRIRKGQRWKKFIEENGLSHLVRS